jgi:general secretion pathway protein D
MRRAILAPLLLVMLAATPARGATIAVGSPSFNAGETFTVAITVQDVTDLVTFSVDLSFDPALLEATGASAGSFLGGCCFFARLPSDPFGVPGVVEFITDGLPGQGPGVSGSGDLALITFLALAAGDPQLALANIILINSADELIEVDVPTTVPEPAVLVLLACGLAALRRRVGG